MTLDIRFSPELEAKLAERAQATGMPVEQIVRQAVEEKLQAPLSPSTLSSDQRLKLWREWVASHPVRPGIHLDDSRESIYAGRGE